MLKAKFKCVCIGTQDGGERADLSVVTSGSVENEQWSQYTPSGELSLLITNPSAQGKFEVGAEYILDIRPAESGE